MPTGTSGSVLVVIVGPPSLAGTRTDVTNYGRAPSYRLTESSPFFELESIIRVPLEAAVNLRRRVKKVFFAGVILAVAFACAPREVRASQDKPKPAAAPAKPAPAPAKAAPAAPAPATRTQPAAGRSPQPQPGALRSPQPAGRPGGAAPARSVGNAGRGGAAVTGGAGGNAGRTGMGLSGGAGNPGRSGGAVGGNAGRGGGGPAGGGGGFSGRTNSPNVGAGPAHYASRPGDQPKALPGGRTEFHNANGQTVTTNARGEVHRIEVPRGLAGGNKMVVNRGPGGARVVETGRAGARAGR